MFYSSSKTLLKPIFFLWLTATVVLARATSGLKPSTLIARLKLDEASPGSGSDSPNCWDSLFQLQSCTGEVLLFFLNGETYLGAGCCSAIRVIHEHCWPTMLGSLGFTAEEGDILQGYCDDAATTTTTDDPPHVPTVKA